MKRIFLFVATNFAVMLVLMAIYHGVCLFLGLDPNAVFRRSTGLDLQALAVFSLVWGMAGGFISLLLSKTIAKFSVSAQTIDGSEGETERWLVDTVRSLAERANVAMPEVAVYHGGANAFATGAFKNHALVAVSDGIIRQLTKEELRAVLGHEMSHVANGDMVTMTLLQGVLNACVIFLSRAVAYLASSALSNGKDNRRGSSGIYYLVYFLLQIVLGLAASVVAMWYSRRREYAADAGSADLLGSPASMIAALRRLGNLQSGTLPDSLKAFGAVGGSRTSLFSTHPSLEDRIEALERRQRGI
ncbi:MAG: protease HtpX [Kiritimatiellia bacterium]